LANAARKLNVLARYLPEGERNKLIASWSSLTDEIAELNQPEARAVIADWLKQTAERYGARPAPQVKANPPDLAPRTRT
jgi:hypothetical protein